MCWSVGTTAENVLPTTEVDLEDNFSASNMRDAFAMLTAYMYYGDSTVLTCNADDDGLLELFTPSQIFWESLYSKQGVQLQDG